jgi:hypothetical protein
MKSATLDLGEPGGGDVVGGSAGAGQPPEPGAEGEVEGEGESDPTTDGLFYHVLPSNGHAGKIDGLKAGDAFFLSKPVKFGRKYEPRDAPNEEKLRLSEQLFRMAAANGRLLVVRGARSTNEWLKGRFRVRQVDDGGNIQADHLTSKVN